MRISITFPKYLLAVLKQERVAQAVEVVVVAVLEVASV